MCECVGESVCGFHFFLCLLVKETGGVRERRNEMVKETTEEEEEKMDGVVVVNDLFNKILKGSVERTGGSWCLVLRAPGRGGGEE